MIQRHRYRIPFGEMGWEIPAPNVQAKAASAGEYRLRLAEFRRGFVEDGWCSKPHTGYVLEGELRLDFASGDRVEVASGDGLHIPLGDAHRHQATPISERVLLILFEPK